MLQSSLTGLGFHNQIEGLVLFSAAVPPLAGEFLYAFKGDASELQPGARLELPLGRRLCPGFVLSVGSSREATSLAEMEQRGVRVKTIAGETRIVQAFCEEHLEFFQWIARYYAEPLSKILDLAVPSISPERHDPFVELVTETEPGRLGDRQRKIVDYLIANQGRVLQSVLRKEIGASAATIRALCAKNVVRLDEKAAVASDTFESPRPAPSELTEEQQRCAEAAIQCIGDRQSRSFLLHGVTGSGKTEVYLEVIIEALKAGRSALVLVPEIALTPQLLHRFEARLREKVAVLHSSLKPRERWEQWTNILSGSVRVAIGARSAIFAPLRNLGVIIVDEEHDSSFKQGEGIRYNGRDLALLRAKLSSCPIILGSATPSLETYQFATMGKHQLFNLKGRYFNSPKLKYQLIDLSRIKPWEMPSKSISSEFLSTLKRTLSQGDQAFVLYNRRGFASYLQCERCEYVLGCPHCSVTLTYHRKPNALLCHFCGFSSAPLVVCPSCGSSERSKSPEPGASAFIERGAGTERVFEELQTLLPSARLAKLDRDAVQSLNDYTDVLERVRSKKVDILVGTQMIAKGHDLPDVTFVGVVDCDVGLHMPDFRAGERVYQLLTQVAGRAGRRDKQGYVALQTRVPTHPSLTMTVRDDFRGFAEAELKARQALGYPPFQRLLRTVVSAEDRATAQSFSMKLADRARSLCGTNVTLLGPAPAPIERTRNHWRYHILFKCSSAAVIQQFLSKLKAVCDPPDGIRVTFDMDPQDML